MSSKTDCTNFIEFWHAHVMSNQAVTMEQPTTTHSLQSVKDMRMYI